MSQSRSRGLVVGLASGAACTALAAVMMGQGAGGGGGGGGGGASQPVKSETQYFVTGEGDHAHLWVREGATLRVVGHGECKAGCPWDKEEHKEGDGHDHGKDKK